MLWHILSDTLYELLSGGVSRAVVHERRWRVCNEPHASCWRHTVLNRQRS